MKKFILFVVVLSILTFLPADVMAASDSLEDEEDYLTAIQFNSISQFEEYLNNCRRNNSFDKIGNIYSILDRVYIPKALKDNSDSIKWILAESRYFYEIHYEIGDTTITLATPLSEWFEWGYKTAEYLYIGRNKEHLREYLWQKSEVGGNTVYSHYERGRACYNWRQDGVYYYLEINEKPDDKHLVYCDVLSIPLNLEPISGNINNNPGTGR